MIRHLRSVSILSLTLLAHGLHGQETPARSQPSHPLVSITRGTSPTLAAVAAPMVGCPWSIALLPGGDDPKGLTWSPPSTAPQSAEVEVQLIDPLTHLAIVADPKTPGILPDGPRWAPGTSSTLKPGTKLGVGGHPERKAAFAGRVKQLDGTISAVALLRCHIEGPALPSGTPLTAEDGRVVGIISQPVAQEGQVSLALPIEAVVKLLNHVQQGSPLTTAKLGIGVNPVSTTPRIEMVGEGSRAEKGGLQVGDILLAIGDREIMEGLDVVEANYFLSALSPLPAKVLRGTDVLQLVLPPDATEEKK